MTLYIMFSWLKRDCQTLRFFQVHNNASLLCRSVKNLICEAVVKDTYADFAGTKKCNLAISLKSTPYRAGV